MLAVDKHAEIELADIAGSTKPDRVVRIGVSKNHEIIATRARCPVRTEDQFAVGIDRVMIEELLAHTGIVAVSGDSIGTGPAR